jgi:simple sugar transport system ATP-binding protein
MGKRTYEYIVRMERIRMAFGNVIALNDVSLTVGRDEIVGLIGDNGAGKSAHNRPGTCAPAVGVH